MELGFVMPPFYGIEARVLTQINCLHLTSVAHGVQNRTSSEHDVAMHIVLLVLAIISTSAPAHAQSAATGIAKEAARGSTAAPLSVEALCTRLTLDEVTAIVGRNFERRADTGKLYQACRYGDSKEKGKLQVRYFSLGNSRLKEAGWRKFVAEAKGRVIERDGVLVSHFRRDRFGTDSIWFMDRQGRALELNVNSGITEDQAVALAKSAMD
ncbi:MAG: hypothetical protein ABI669_14135 [Usitatibacter sp.]